MQKKKEHRATLSLRPDSGQSRPRIAPLRVAIADDDPAVCETLAAMLMAIGHQVACVAPTGHHLLARCRLGGIDLAISDIRMPDMGGLEAACLIDEQCPLPLILLSAYADHDLIEQAERTPALAYLVKPVSPPQLEAAIVLALRRFDELCLLRRETGDLRQALADRKLIDRAKGIFMRHLRISEQDAFSRMQRLASNKNRKLVEIAEMITTAAEAFQREPVIER